MTKQPSPVALWIDLMRELVDPEYKPPPPLIRERLGPHLKAALKHLDGDIKELERRLRNYMDDDHAKNIGFPTGWFYRDIEHWKMVDRQQEWA